MQLSWKLTLNSNEQKTLLNAIGFVYDIDLFLCSSGHFEVIIFINESEFLVK